MLGLPLHPIVVHFPIVLSVLLPVAVVVALWAIRRGAAPRRAWSAPLAAAAALTLSAFVATRTGESEEDRVERVVAESAIEEHEEAGELFLMLSGVLLVVATAGLLPRTVGQAARVVTAAGALGLVAAGVVVGHSGGALVYREGAAAAYTNAAGAATGAAGAVAKAARPADDADDHR